MLVQKTDDINVLYRLLDLMPRQEFLNYYKLGKDNRQSGRTTKMLLEALIKSQYNPVIVSGFNADYTKSLRKDLLIIATDLGWETGNIVKPNSLIFPAVGIREYWAGNLHKYNMYLIKQSKYSIFEDHYHVNLNYSCLKGT